jgi:hypothetical protein
MALFESDALYGNVKGCLRLLVDVALFIPDSGASATELQFHDDPMNRPINVFRKTKRVEFTISEVKHTFTIIEEENDGNAFQDCLVALRKLVDPATVLELREASKEAPFQSSSRSSSQQTIASSSSSTGSQATSHLSELSPRSSGQPPLASSPTPFNSVPVQSATNLPTVASSSLSTSPIRAPVLTSRRSDYFLFVEVKEPQVDSETATYLVAHRTNMPEYSVLESQVRRRYSQFEALYNVLTQRFSRLSSVPDLPVKTWFKRFDKAFLDQRTRELNQWLKAVAMDEYMHRSAELVHFLTDAAPVPQLGPTGYVEKLIRPFVDNQMVVNIGDTINGAVQQVLTRTGAGSASASAQMLVGSPLERDYHAARALMEQWKLTPRKLPFPKFVTLLLGSTSSGKSAFVNHHFGCVVRKSTDHQQDTDFTVVEVIPAAEFYALAGTKERIVHRSQAMMHPDAVVIEDEQFQKPIEDYESDWRTGRVFIRLNSNQLLARYEQLKPYAKDGLFRACLINEAALDRKSASFDLACNSILIDSPGFATIQSAEIAEKFRGTLVVLQYLYNMCDLLLYFVPCGQISTLAQHLPMLELALTYASHGEKIGDEMLKTLFSKQLQEAKSSGGFLSFCSSIASSIVSQASYSYSTDQAQSQQFKGASVWHKSLFILSKVDILFRQANPALWHRILLSQYYELGVLLGSALAHLDPPVHDQCLTIGLPEFQKGLAPSPSSSAPTIAPTGDLELLHAKMLGREQEAPYIERLEMAIQQMCQDLEKAMAGSFMTMGAHQTMLDLRSRSETRNKTRQTGIIPPR